MSSALGAPWRRGLLGLAGVSLLAGMWAGLARIGWTLPTLDPNLSAAHGPLMVAGFLSLVISLERAVALGRTWGFVAPALAAVGSLLLLAGIPAAISLVASGLVLLAIFVRLYRIRPEWSAALLTLGALAWLAGNVLWLAGRPLALVVPWWAGFLVFTIAGERLELAQVLLPARSRVLLLLANAILLLGLFVSAGFYTVGVPIAGAGLLALAAWLMRYDIARRTLRRRGLPRFSGAALIAGYVWLAVAGLLWLLGQERLPAALWYDAMLHTVFLGFAFSMIVAHAPTIVPAITGIAVEYRPRFYIHLALLHASLLLRIAGDLVPWPEARRWGGLLNVVAILLFAASTALASSRPQITRRGGRPPSRRLAA